MTINIPALSSSDQKTVVKQLKGLLESSKRKFRRYAGYLHHFVSNVKKPFLTSEKSRLIFCFEFLPIFNYGECETRLIFHPLDLPQDLKNLVDLKPAQGVLKLSTTCNCGSDFDYYPCGHSIAVVDFLYQRLAKSSPQEALAWMQECVHTPESMGEQLIEELRGFFASPNKIDEYRINWRLAVADARYRQSFPFQVVCYLQKKKQKGDGWSVGRKIRNILETIPGCAFQSASDRTLAIFCEMISESYGDDDGWEILEMLRLLEGNPDLCWDVEGLPKATIERATPQIELIESGASFEPTLTVNGEPLDSNIHLMQLGKDTLLGVVTEIGASIKYFTLSDEQANCLQRVLRARSRGAKLNNVSATRLAETLAGRDTQRLFPVRLPDALAGPKVPLPPVVELRLAPKSEGCLEACLRVASDALDDAPVPGMPPDCLLVQAASGPIQFQRDLPAEIDAANRHADALRMGDYLFDGPYTWLTRTIDESLQLIERARQLGEGGPTVCWPSNKPMRVVGEITPKAMRIRLTSDRDWFGIEGELSIEGLEVPLAELFAALRSGSRFVPLGQGQFATIGDSLRERLAMIDDLAFPERSRTSVPRVAAGLIQKALGDDIPVEADLRWRDAMERLNDRTRIPSKAPKKLRAELRDYQLDGYKWLAQLSHWGLGGCLADDMGLGKTVQTLGVLLDRASTGPALIVAPTSVGTNWVRETNKFAPSLAPHLYREHDRDELIKSASSGDLVITSYQMLQRDVQRFASRQWATLVLDESQFIKNFNTKTNQAVRELDVDWCVALSGTPLENHLGELWSLMRVISPGLLGSWERFRQRFGEPIERGKDKDRLKALSRVVQPFVLRRTKNEVLKELPPRTEVLLTAELSTAERKRYDAARLAALADLTAPNKDANDQQKRIRVLAWLTRLRQLACHVRLVDERWRKSSAKLDLFMETVQELIDNKHRALVFSQFVQHLAIVREALDIACIRYQYLDGSTPPNKRQEAVDAFQNGDGELFLISLKAGGTGLNLTAADYVLHLDPWWNPAVEDQATDRAHRIGQTQKVTVYRLVAKNTIEEQILAMHADKRELLAGVLDGADQAGKMSTQELVDLIRLSNLPDE